MLPVSGSVKVVVGTVKLKVWPAGVDWSGSGLATIGASLTFCTVNAKTSEAARLPESVAVTRRSRLPTWASSGAPLKVRVAGLKESHDGRALPALSVALYVSVSPLILVGKCVCRHLNRERGTLRHRLIGHWVGHRGRIVHVLNREREHLGGTEAATIRGLHGNIQEPDIAIERRPLNVPVLASKLSQLGKAAPVSSVAL